MSNPELGSYSEGENAPQGAEKPAEKKPDIREFHEKALASGAYDKLDERKRRIVEAYLTTPASFKDLGPLAGGVSGERVKQIFDRGIRELRRNLPQEVKEELMMEEEHIIYQHSGPPIRETRRRVRGLNDFEWPDKPYRPHKPHRRNRYSSTS